MPVLAITPTPVADLLPFAIGDRVDLPLPGLAPIAGRVTGITPGKLFVTRMDGRNLVLPRHHLGTAPEAARHD